MRWFLIFMAMVQLPSISFCQSPEINKRINAAVERGVDFLRERFSKNDGSYNARDDKEGLTALAAWTLLESGIPSKDPVIQKAAEYLRPACLKCQYTYPASLEILFFDKLGDPADEALIESLAVRLLAGQNKWGGWTYVFPPIDPKEQDRLELHLKKAREGSLTFPPKGEKRQPSPEILRQLAKIIPLDDGSVGDNSNTHFAMLALWAARRHGLALEPLDNALQKCGRRFLESQSLKSGGWGYRINLDNPRGENPEEEITSSPSMSCVGLIGLALAQGVTPKKGDPARDPVAKAIQRGLQLVSVTVGQPTGRIDEAHKFKDGAGNNYYFLWTLERMAVLYDLKTIGGKDKDWYNWGAEILVANQGGDGNWANGKYHQFGAADTCFALLFLKKVNIAADLTPEIKIQDPGAPKDLKITFKDLPIPLAKVNDARETKKDPDPLPKKPDLPKVEPKTPDPGPDARLEAGKLITALGKEPANKHDAILDKILKGQGAIYTQELASAIPDLPGPTQAKARATLAQRLSQLPIAGLRKEMKSLDVEIRRAAAVAAGQAKAKDNIPDLIDLLDDPETPVLLAAHQALKQLTSQDFGPQADATRTEIRQAAAEWRAWWKKQQK